MSGLRLFRDNHVTDATGVKSMKVYAVLTLITPALVAGLVLVGCM